MSRTNSLNLYCKDISKYPLIDRKAEIELGKKILNGDEKAVQELIHSNLRFVISIANRYRHTQMPLMDIISEGNVGLTIAAKSFDYRKGLKFINYARYWILECIKVALYNNRLIRLPQNVQKTKSEWFLRKVKEEKELTNETDQAVLTNKILDRYRPRMVSLDVSFKKQEDSKEMGVDKKSYLIDKSSCNFIVNLEKESRNKKLKGILNKLIPADKKVLEHLFSDDAKLKRTDVQQHHGPGRFKITNGYREVGKKMGISYERVRQRKERALKVLRTLLDQEEMMVG